MGSVFLSEYTCDSPHLGVGSGVVSGGLGCLFFIWTGSLKFSFLHFIVMLKIQIMIFFGGGDFYLDYYTLFCDKPKARQNLHIDSYE